MSDTFAAFSGGRSSAVMLHQMIANGASPRAAIFCNTGMESDETLDFVKAVKDHILSPAGVPLHCIEFCYEKDKTGALKEGAKEVPLEKAARNGEPMLEFAKRKGTPNIASRLCTQVLKIEAQGRFINERYGLRYDWIKALGFRADEKSRIAKSKEKTAAVSRIINAGNLPRIGVVENSTPLADYGIDTEGVKKIISTWGDWAKIAKGQMHLSNCVGCFFMKGDIYDRAAMFNFYPKHGALWIKLEAAKPEAVKGYPHAAQRIHLKEFCKDLPKDLLLSHMANPDKGFWRQAQMIWEQGDARFTLQELDFTGGGCGDGDCGTDL